MYFKCNAIVCIIIIIKKLQFVLNAKELGDVLNLQHKMS